MEELRKLHLNILNFVEIWKVVNGYEGLYKVSSLGRVKNIKTGKILKGCVDDKGYLKVKLYKNKKGKTLRIHNLVGKAFIANPLNKRCIDHINHDRKNNKVSNLRFATYAENNQNASKRSDNTSGFIGIHFNKKVKKWHVRIQIDGKRKSLGYFKDLTLAIQSRKAAEKKYYGEYAPQ